ncbi:hypothetical protein Cni_G16238 [Canna indica]|uniref:Transcription repressor n=1 Tax=Canna indica TaxID=4628 RepID=A0AAQ3KKQ6_9LILI|nr:hypothetical protein Cni_G16238 [Canna indica]
MEKLKSSFRNLQGTISSMKPLAPICIQEAKTQSFREGDLRSSFHYCTSSSFSSSFTSSSNHAAASTNSPSSSPSTEKDGKCRKNNAAFEGHVSPNRFFFSPCTTKSIMEEANKDHQPTMREPAAPGGFYEASTVVVISSEDPYHDFRASMEEMVAAHQLWEWHSLEDLLQCYLRVNEKKNHKVIVLAFMDLLMHLMDQCKQVSSDL